MAYGSGETLGACVEHLAAQTFRDFELVLIDNASPQREAQPVAARHGFIRLIENTENLGFAGAMNQAEAGKRVGVVQTAQHFATTVDGERDRRAAASHGQVALASRRLSPRLILLRVEDRRFELLDVVQAAMARLPAGYRAILTLHDVEGLSNPDIAESLGISLPAVKSRVHRSRLFVRKRLAEDDLTIKLTPAATELLVKNAVGDNYTLIDSL